LTIDGTPSVFVLPASMGKGHDSVATDQWVDFAIKNQPCPFMLLSGN
jgi:hypothetical protein